MRAQAGVDNASRKQVLRELDPRVQRCREAGGEGVVGRGVAIDRPENRSVRGAWRGSSYTYLDHDSIAQLDRERCDRLSVDNASSWRGSQREGGVRTIGRKERATIDRSIVGAHPDVDCEGSIHGSGVLGYADHQ